MTDKIKWHRIDAIRKMAGGEIAAKVTVPADSPWFSGHFPGNPVLPGIAQIDIVFDIINTASGKGHVLKKVYRTKYRRVIGPDEQIDVVVFPSDPAGDNWRFEINAGSQTACRGRLQARAAG
jgi:3-hydroxymyristoyl/3-hydroxydecanoyl-(acyl carrier protein) dehydratase